MVHVCGRRPRHHAEASSSRDLVGGQWPMRRPGGARVADQSRSSREQHARARRWRSGCEDARAASIEHVARARSRRPSDVPGRVSDGRHAASVRVPTSKASRSRCSPSEKLDAAGSSRRRAPAARARPTRTRAPRPTYAAAHEHRRGHVRARSSIGCRFRQVVRVAVVEGDRNRAVRHPPPRTALDQSARASTWRTP